jgi:hypothetical protein
MDKQISEIKLNPEHKEIVKPLGEEKLEARHGETAPKSAGVAKKIVKPLGIIFGGLIVVFLVLFVVIGLPAYKVYADGIKAYAMAKQVKDALKSQDIKKITDSLVATKNQVVVVENDLQKLAWTKAFPFVGGYTSDAMHAASAAQHSLEAAEIMSRSVEPYSDLLGLKGQGSYVGGTAEERIMKMVETLSKVTPQIDQIADKMKLVQDDVNKIDPNRYPETIKGKAVRGTIIEAKKIVDYSGTILTQARPLVKNLPNLLGTSHESKYMVLFQNDKELRPTGGFITAYAIFRVEKGKISLNEADDIYKLDDTVRGNVTPPDPIKKYLNVYGWRLRDANFSPDFESSMKTFQDIFANSSKKQVLDGIVVVDTHFLVKLMEIIGPVEIYGQTYTAKIVPECNCPMVVYELLKQAGTPRNYWTDNRKDMIGILLQALMKKALASPKQVYAPLFQSMFDLSYEKHLLFFLNDIESEKGVQAIDFGGKIKTVPYDYLHISDANLGGAKSNLYVVRSVKQDVSITDKGADNTVTVSYKYPHGADNCSLERKEGLCLAGIYRNYMRIYLPKGATIKEVTGFENKSTTFEDLGHTVVDGFITIVPQGLGKITIKYSVAGDFKAKGEYRELIQKQPGTVGDKYQLIVNGKLQEFPLTTDQDLVIKL